MDSFSFDKASSNKEKEAFSKKNILLDIFGQFTLYMVKESNCNVKLAHKKKLIENFGFGQELHSFYLNFQTFRQKKRVPENF